VHARAVDLNRLGIEIDGELAGLNHGLRMTLRATHDRMNAGDQFVLVERLGHVIVGAKPKATNLILDPDHAGENEDRGRNLGNAQRFQDIEAAHIRQVQIQQDNVVVIELAEVYPLLAKVRRVNVEAFRLQHELDALRGCAVIFNEQNSHQIPLSRQP